MLSYEQIIFIFDLKIYRELTDIHSLLYFISYKKMSLFLPATIYYMIFLSRKNSLSFTPTFTREELYGDPLLL